MDSNGMDSNVGNVDGWGEIFGEGDGSLAILRNRQFTFLNVFKCPESGDFTNLCYLK